MNFLILKIHKNEQTNVCVWFLYLHDYEVIALANGLG